mmetsp:Transcript_16802/g.51623  ORF Transcript_16802/g.51623 Transcript_16802/m.51623 type:complete len:642 (-) Transcript_16802:357-2282(-)
MAHAVRHLLQLDDRALRPVRRRRAPAARLAPEDETHDAAAAAAAVALLRRRRRGVRGRRRRPAVARVDLRLGAAVAAVVVVPKVVGRGRRGGRLGAAVVLRLARLHELRDGLGAADEVGVRRVDVAELDLNHVGDHLLRRRHAAPQELGDHLRDAVAQLREARDLRGLALRADALHLLEYEVAALQPRLLQPRDLALDQQVKADLRHEERLPRAVRVRDDRADLVVGQAVEGIKGLQAPPKDVVEDVADARAAVELRHLRAQARLARARAAPAVNGCAEAIAEARDELEQSRAERSLRLVRGRLAERIQLRLDLHEQRGDALLDIGQRVADVVHEDLVEHARHVLGAAARQHVPVHRVVPEELRLLLLRLGDLLAVVDVALSAIDDADVAEAQGDDAVLEHLRRVRAGVHEVQLGDDAHRAGALGIHLARHLERVGVGEVRVPGGNREDDGVGVLDVLHAHVVDLELNVRRLVAHRHLGDPGQVHEREVEHGGAVDAQRDGLRADALVAPGGAVRLALDLLTDLLKVVDLVVRAVQELAVGLLILPAGLPARVEELQDQRPPRHDAGAARQEVLTHDVLEHRRLARRLRADDHDLRQVYGRVSDGVEDILQLVHHGDEVLHGGGAGSRGLRVGVRESKRAR